MLQCQPALNGPLSHAQSPDNDAGRKTCLFEGEHLLIPCFTNRLARSTRRWRNGKRFGWHLGLARVFGQMFPAPGNHFIQVFGQVFRDMPAIGYMLGVGKSRCNSGRKLAFPDPAPRW
jgi:hypothetical protein